MLIKNAMRYHCRAITIKKEEEVEEEDEKKGEKEKKVKEVTTSSAGKKAEQLEILYTAGRNAK